MIESDRKRVIFIISLVVLSFLVLLPNVLRGGDGSSELPQWWPFEPVKLGLDLRGGAYFVLRVVTKEAVKSHIGATALAIKSELKKEKIPVIRVRQVGDLDLEVNLLNENSIERVKDYIRAEYPELVEIDAASTEAGSSDRRVSYRLKESEASEIEKLAVEQAIETIRNRVDQYGVAEPIIQRAGEKLIQVQLPDVVNVEEVKKSIELVAKLEFHLQSNASDGADVISLPSRDGGKISVERDVLMTGDAIKDASVQVDPQSNEISVSLTFTSVGAKTFDRITGDNVGRNLAIVLDGVSQSAPRINERISGGSARITGRYMLPEARQLAIVLRSGALPAPLVIETERSVGASLGADSIRKGILSLIIGSGLVLLFAVFYYKKSGVLTVGCLILNLVFLVSLLAMAGATLTLPGLAGIILTVGMAIDANVIIFERIKEELRAGSGVSAAIRGGYEKAHWTVLDANITSLLTGVILFGFGTGPIKGFAVTLCLGILTSMFTALYVSKLGFRIFSLRRGDGTLSI